MFREQPQAFISLPSDPTSLELRHMIEAALEDNGAFAGDNSKPAAGVQQSIRDADFLIADVTGADPNVMLEVGMAIGMGKRTLLLSQVRLRELPLGLAAQQVAVYRPDNLSTVVKYVRQWVRDVMSEREAFRAS